MIQLDKLKTGTIYSNDVLDFFTNGKDKYNETAFILLSEELDSISRLSGCNPLSSVVSFVKFAYTADNSLRSSMNRKIKALSASIKPITALEKAKKENVLIFSNSLMALSGKSSETKVRKIFSDINKVVEELTKLSYNQIIILIDASVSENIYMLDILVDYWRIIPKDMQIILFSQMTNSVALVNNSRKKDIESVVNSFKSSLNNNTVATTTDSNKDNTTDLREKVLARLAVMVNSTPGSVNFDTPIIKGVDRIISTVSSGATEDEILSLLADDREVQRELDKMQATFKEMEARNKKIKVLENKQADIIVTIDKKKMKLSEFLKADDADVALGFFSIPDAAITDPQMKSSRVKQINRIYAKQFFFSDAVKIMLSLNTDPEIPTYLTSLSILDTSDAFNKVWTISADIQTASGKRQKLVIDLPKVTDDGIMYLNGSKKFIAKQMIALPIIKRKENQVQITTQYNKTFVERQGTKLSAPVEKLRKFLSNKKSGKISAVTGDASKLVPKQRNALVFEDLSKSFISITVGDWVYDFDTIALEARLKEKYPVAIDSLFRERPNCTIVGSSSNKIMYVDSEEIFELEAKTGSYVSLGNQSLVYVIASQIKAVNESAYNELVKTSTGKIFSYSIVRLLQRTIPSLVLLGFKDGLESVISKYGIKYEVRSKRISFVDLEKMKMNMIQFKDSFLYYDASKISHELLMNGLLAVPTRNYTFEDMNRATPYLDFFDQNYNTRNIGKGFRNFWQKLIDPITEGILKQQNIPYDFTGLILYANTMLADNTKKAVTDVSNYRIRSVEIIAQALYQELSAAFLQYKTDVAAGSTRKSIQVRKNGVIRRVIDSQNVEELSLLSPVIELEAQDKTTFKGIGGINKEESFTDEFRTFDPSMVGTFGYFTPVSSQAGITRTLSYNANVQTARGFIKSGENAGDKNASELLSAVELLNPFTATRADPLRIGMTTTQNKHVTPTIKQSKPLINSGVHKAIAHLIGDDFVFKAKDDGVVKKIDNKNEVIVLAYSNGENGLIDIKSKLNKNSKAGFYLESKLQHSLKEGQKFKTGEILAYDPTFFKPGADFSGGKNSIELATGLLRKVALTTDAGTFEDSMIESQSLAQDLGFPVVTDKFVSLGKNSHVSKIVKIGQEIKASDPLMVFENSFDESEVNDVLKRLGSEFGEEILELGRNTISSKTSGRIVDIRIFYNVPITELSSSLQKIVKDFINTNKRRANIVMKVKSDDIVQVSSMTQSKYDKIFGNEFEGVLIQFFVSHVDQCTVGDKVSAQVALKGVISEVMDDNERPYTENAKDDPIDLVVSPMSLVSRMTVDLFFNLYCNKVLVELKRTCQKIWSSS